MTVHDVLRLARPNFVRGWQRCLHAKAMLATMAARASAVLCDSNFAHDDSPQYKTFTKQFNLTHLGTEGSWLNR